MRNRLWSRLFSTKNFWKPIWAIMKSTSSEDHSRVNGFSIREDLPMQISKYKKTYQVSLEVRVDGRSLKKCHLSMLKASISRLVLKYKKSRDKIWKFFFIDDTSKLYTNIIQDFSESSKFFESSEIFISEFHIETESWTEKSWRQNTMIVDYK